MKTFILGAVCVVAGNYIGNIVSSKLPAGVPPILGPALVGGAVLILASKVA